MNNAQWFTLVATGGLAAWTQKGHLLDALEVIAGKASTTATIKTDFYSLGLAIVGVIALTWLAGVNSDTEKIAIALVIALWLVYLMHIKGA